MLFRPTSASSTGRGLSMVTVGKPYQHGLRCVDNTPVVWSMHYDQTIAGVQVLDKWFLHGMLPPSQTHSQTQSQTQSQNLSAAALYFNS